MTRGGAGIGFRQRSEPKPVARIGILGPLPPGLRKMAVFSAGVVQASRHRGAAALIACLASPAAAGAIRDSGMEPLGESTGQRDRR